MAWSLFGQSGQSQQPQTQQQKQNPQQSRFGNPLQNSNGNQNNQNNSNGNRNNWTGNGNNGVNDPNNMNGNQNNNTNMNGNGGQGNPGNQQQQQQAHPMDAFAAIFENKGQQQDNKPPAFTLDPKLMSEVAGKQNFLDGIDQDLVQKATSGDVSSMIELMNKVGQNSYRAALEHGSVLTDKFVGARSSFDMAGISGHVKKELTTQALTSEGGPNFSHPVVKKQLIQFAEMFQAANPEAQPQEVARMAKEYITELSNAVNAKPQDPSTQEADPEKKWDSFFA